MPFLWYNFPMFKNGKLEKITGVAVPLGALYSKDSLYYKENEWYTDLSDDSKPYKVGTYILSIDAFLKDAKAHNEVFLNILKDGFKQKRF